MASTTKRRPAPDQEHRDAAVAERARNVLLDAGAGTGKTTILIDRLLRLLVPEDGADPSGFAARVRGGSGGGEAPCAEQPPGAKDPAPIPIHRIAAVTFTRRAAGELRLRLRERLLAEAAREDLSVARRDALRKAIDGVDAAHVGTIHSFADRLLRLHPVEAGLSPSYEIVEDIDDLVDETLHDLLYGAHAGTLGGMLRGTGALSRAAEVEETVRMALDAGVPAGSKRSRHRTVFGLRDLIAGFAEHRDVPPEDPAIEEFDPQPFREKADEFIDMVVAIPRNPAAEGTKWLHETASLLRRCRDETDPAKTYREIYWPLTHAPNNNRPRKKDEFAGDAVAYDAWKTYDGSRTGENKGRPALRDEILAPFRRWLAVRLVRTFPVVVALYERAKARRRVLDQIDLLVKLRDLLRDKPEVRGEYQRLFDCVLIDEFQDTDPLQAEIAAYLCESGPEAKSWEETRLAPGKLTIVGDPKQSIYRFRRADVAMYDRVRSHVLRDEPLVAPLTANFRSRPSLIEFFNDRFSGILGEPPGDSLFDPEGGKVFHRKLDRGRDGCSDEPRVHVVPMELAGSASKADAWRRLEAEALAAYLDWLADRKRSGVSVTDPLTGEEREVRFGDIAVLAISTSTLPLLFAELDRMRVPWTSRGGRLFLEDPLHRRFFLALRAIADADDGAAEAALLRPPFFALEPADHLAYAASRSDPSTEAARRVQAARDVVVDLRRRRFERSPGATARDVLERTGLARAAALSPNGEQRLARLRELCSQVDRLAAREGLDFDGVSARLRRWVDDPVQLDPPSPVGSEAVQVVTVHQAKGLEFPVVVLWDCRAEIGQRMAVVPPWAVSRDGGNWMLSIDRVEWDSGQGFLEREKNYRNAERLRVVYVAATRARDLLVLPISRDAEKDPLGANARYVTGRLVHGAPAGTLHVMDTYREGSGAAWASKPPAAAVPVFETDERAEAALHARWTEAADEVSKPRFRPRGASSLAHIQPRAEDETASPAAAPPGGRRGRFGAVFGDTVHLAIGHALRGLPAEEAVRRAARASGLSERFSEAVGDVSRALAALKAAGLLPGPGVELMIEYPVSGPGPDGTLLSGYVDLLAAGPFGFVVVDFKTDPPPDGDPEQAYPAYAAQLRGYVDLLAPIKDPRGSVRAFLLFTASGRMFEFRV